MRARELLKLLEDTDLTKLSTEELKKAKKMIENNYHTFSNKKQAESDYDDIVAELKKREQK
jgi:hypothetical protein